MNDGSARTDTDAAHAAGAGVLQVSDVTVRFGGLTALEQVSLTVPPRLVTGVIGPNGAGKTTLLNVLCGFVRPESGRLSWDGRELTRLRPHRLAALGIARTLQGVGLFRRLSVLENVMVGANCRARSRFGSALLGLPWSDRDERLLRERAMAALTEAGIVDLARRMPTELPYGTQKRVALARALVSAPRLLLLDEPASGLSAAELEELGQLIRRLATGTSVVVIEHHMDLMMSVCDTITVLDFGRVIASGSPEQVRADPAVTAAYLGSPDASADNGGAANPGAANPGSANPGSANPGSANPGARNAGAGNGGGAGDHG
jgi:branched-chain amino acid transport system ATP-binding protein